MRWFGECSPKHHWHSLIMLLCELYFRFRLHSFYTKLGFGYSNRVWLVWWYTNVHGTFGDNFWLFTEKVGDTSAILLRCIGEHQRSFGDASPRHQWKWGVDLCKFLSWFMSMIYLYYFTCIFLSHMYVHFCYLLLFVQCTELDGILHYK